MGHLYSGTGEAAESLGAATEETLIQLRGTSTRKARIKGFGVSFNGTSSSAEPVVVRLLRQTTDGTATGGSEVAWDPDAPAASCAVFHSFTAEPTAGGVLMDFLVHPQGGMFSFWFPLGDEPQLGAAATSRIGLSINAPAAVSARGWLAWEE